LRIICKLDSISSFNSKKYIDEKISAFNQNEESVFVSLTFGDDCAKLFIQFDDE